MSCMACIRGAETFCAPWIARIACASRPGPTPMSGETSFQNQSYFPDFGRVSALSGSDSSGPAFSIGGRAARMAACSSGSICTVILRRTGSTPLATDAPGTLIRLASKTGNGCGASATAGPTQSTRAARATPARVIVMSGLDCSTLGCFVQRGPRLVTISRQFREKAATFSGLGTNMHLFCAGK